MPTGMLPFDKEGTPTPRLLDAEEASNLTSRSKEQSQDLNQQLHGGGEYPSRGGRKNRKEGHQDWAVLNREI